MLHPGSRLSLVEWGHLQDTGRQQEEQPFLPRAPAAAGRRGGGFPVPAQAGGANSTSGHGTVSTARCWVGQGLQLRLCQGQRGRGGGAGGRTGWLPTPNTSTVGAGSCGRGPQAPSSYIMDLDPRLQGSPMALLALLSRGNPLCPRPPASALLAFAELLSSAPSVWVTRSNFRFPEGHGPTPHLCAPRTVPSTPRTVSSQTSASEWDEDWAAVSF